jgi:hypothetical protein
MSIMKRVLVTVLLASLGLTRPARADGPAVSEPVGPVSSAATFPKPEVRVWQMGLMRADRLQHVTFSYTAGLMLGLTSQEPLAAASGAMVIGLAKELWDARTGRFDSLDLVADALGAAGALATTVTLTR